MYGLHATIDETFVAVRGAGLRPPAHVDTWLLALFTQGFTPGGG